MNPENEKKSALPLEELELAPQWVRAGAKSYANHSGEDRAEGRRRRDWGDGGGDSKPRRPKSPGFGGAPAGPARSGGRSGFDRGAQGQSRGPAGDHRPSSQRPSGPQRGGPSSQRSGPPPRRGGPSSAPQRSAAPPAQLQPPPVDVVFYPEDKGFASMVEAIKQSPRAYALFDVAKLVLNKPERHVVKLARKPAADGQRPPLFVVTASEMPFLSQDEAVRYTLRNFSNKICRQSKVPIDPPKGNFSYVNRCGFTGEILGPPNHHEYMSRIVRHHQHRLAHVPFDQFKARIQTVKDEAAVKAWLDSMSFKIEFECLCCAAAAAPAPSPSPAEIAPAPAAEAASEPATDVPADNATTAESAVESSVANETVEAPATEATPAPEEAVASESATPAEPATPTEEPAPTPATPSAPAVTFASRTDLEKHFIEKHLPQFITTATEIRLSGVASRRIEQHAIADAVRLTWEDEMHFPLETANGMRGRLRGAGFHFFKHDKGITYLGSIRRNHFASLGELSERIQKIVAFLRANPRGKRKQLLAHFKTPPPAAPVAVPTDAIPAADAGAPVETVVAAAPVETVAPSAPPETPVAAPTPAAPLDEDRLIADLHWLIHDGYVVEFSDGRLWAMPDQPPPQPPPAPKKSTTKPKATGDSTSAPVDATVVATPETGATANEPASEVHTESEVSATVAEATEDLGHG